MNATLAAIGIDMRTLHLNTWFLPTLPRHAHSRGWRERTLGV